LRRWQSASPLGLVFAAFVLAFYTIVFIIPFGTGIWLAFQNWDFVVEPRFIGLRNFRQALQDKYFWQALITTLKFAAVEIPIAVSLMILLALLLSQLSSRWQRLFLGLYYLPAITPTMVSILLWRWLYLPAGGAFNTILTCLGLPEQPFLTSPNQALWCIMVMVIWTFLGSGAVLFLAGMNEIPESLIEAAKLDGAGFWQQFFHITLPLIRPVLYYQIIVSVIGIGQMFAQFQMMPGPGFSTRTLALYTYHLGFQAMNLGYGAAVSLIIFLLLLAATVAQLQRYRVSWEY